MKHIGLAVLIALGAMAMACGGPDKPPMTPDSPDMMATDGGSDTPTVPVPTQPGTPSAK